eukprot:2104935-Alexandrium_andersonii.AAC.1
MSIAIASVAAISSTSAFMHQRLHASSSCSRSGRTMARDERGGSRATWVVGSRRGIREPSGHQ